MADPNDSTPRTPKDGRVQAYGLPAHDAEGLEGVSPDSLDEWIAAELGRYQPYKSYDSHKLCKLYRRALTLLQEHRAALRDIMEIGPAAWGSLNEKKYAAARAVLAEKP